MPRADGRPTWAEFRDAHPGVSARNLAQAWYALQKPHVPPTPLPATQATVEAPVVDDEPPVSARTPPRSTVLRCSGCGGCMVCGSTKPRAECRWEPRRSKSGSVPGAAHDGRKWLDKRRQLGNELRLDTAQPGVRRRIELQHRRRLRSRGVGRQGAARLRRLPRRCRLRRNVRAAAMTIWVNSTVTRGEWMPLSAVTSALAAPPTAGVDFRLAASQTRPIRVSDDTWRDAVAWTSQLSQGE